MPEHLPANVRVLLEEKDRGLRRSENPFKLTAQNDRIQSN
jgi:hypothetical protein